MEQMMVPQVHGVLVSVGQWMPAVHGLAVHDQPRLHRCALLHPKLRAGDRQATLQADIVMRQHYTKAIVALLLSVVHPGGKEVRGGEFMEFRDLHLCLVLTRWQLGSWTAPVAAGP